MEQTPKRKPRTRSIVVAAIVIILSFALFTFLNLGQVFAEEILGELVQRQTNGYYSLEFDDIKVDVLEREITVEQLYLQADSVRISEETGLNTVYEIQLSELIINIKSLFKFYFQKKLEIESMRIVDPEIRMQRIGERTSRSFSFETGNLYKAISDYLTVLKVDYFRIQDGDLNYNTDEFSIGNIDFQIQNLLLDSVVRNDVFYSETIFLEIQNQKYILPDSIHEIEFDRFVLSTQDSILKFENLSIHPTEASGVRFEDDNEVNVYDIHIPELALKGIDYQSAYRNDHLVIEELSFTQPTIFVDDETHGKVRKKEQDNSLLRLLFTIFHRIEIGKLAIDDSQIDLKINNDKTYQRIQSEETSIQFLDIRLDTANYRFNKPTKYFENVEISITNYDYILPDSLHEITFDHLRVSSSDSVLAIQNLAIAGAENGAEANISLNVPTIQLSGFVYKDLIDKNLTVEELLIDQLDLQLKGIQQESAREKKEARITSYYESMAPIFQEVDIDRFTLGNASLKLPKGIEIGDLDLRLEGLLLNDKTRSLTDLFVQSNMSIKDVKIDRDSIQISGKKGQLSYDLTSLELSDWDLSIHNRKLDLDGTIAEIQVTELNPDSLLHGNLMTFKKAFITSPKFEIKQLRSSDSTKSGSLGIEKEIVVTDGHLSFEKEGLAFSIESIDADFYLGDSIAVHDVDVQGVTTTLAKANQQLELERLTYDTIKDEMSFIGLHANPIDPSDSAQTLLQGTIPAIRISGFIQDQFFDHQEFIADEVFIETPNVIAHVVPSENQEQPNSELAVKVKAIGLSDGQLLLSGLGKDLTQLAISNVNLNVSGIDYPHSDDLFYSKDIQLNVSSVLPQLASGDQLSTGMVTYSQQSISIDSVQYYSKNGAVSALAENLFLRNLNLPGLLDNEGLQAEEISLQSPQLTIYQTPKAEKGTATNTEPFPIHLDEFHLNDIAIQYLDTLRRKSYALDQADLHFKDVYHDGSFQLDKVLQNTERVDLQGAGLEIPLNEYYSIQTGPYAYASDGESLSITDVHLIPQYSKIDYSDKLETQTDWFDAEVTEVSLKGLDLVEILQDSMVQLEQVHLNGTDLFIYRDKHLPFPDDQIGALPPEQILSIPYPIAIDTIFFKGHVAYEEQPDDFEETGLITFDNIDAQILNFTNTNIEPSTMMHLLASGQIVEQGRFNVEARFELDRPDQRFSFRGTVNDLPMDSLNQMLGPVARVNIKSGMAEEIDFQFMANDTLATGEMVFLYKDLKLQVLNAKKHETNLGSGLMSFFANTFVIRSRNPRFLFPRKGKIYFKRDTSKAVFNYWGKSILSGAVSSVGIHKSDRQQKKDSKAARK